MSDDDLVLRPSEDTLKVSLDDEVDSVPNGTPPAAAEPGRLHVVLDDEAWSPDPPPGAVEAAAAATPVPLLDPAGPPPGAAPPMPSSAPTPSLGAPPLGPPPGPPSTPFPTPPPLETSPTDGRWTAAFGETRTWLAIGGAALAVAVVLGVALVVMNRDQGVSPDEVVTEGGDEVAQLGDDLGGAQRLADFREVGATAADQAATIEDLLAQAEEIEGEQTRTAVMELLTTQQALLTSAAELQSVRAADLTGWPDLATELDQQVQAMEQAEQALPDSLQETSTATLDVGALTQAVVRADDYITGAEEQLTAWREETETQQFGIFLRAGALADYSTQFGALVARYDDLRQELSDFSARIESDPFITYAEAYTGLDQAATAREQVRTSLNALQPPEAVAAAHAAMIGVLDRGISGCRDASEGIRQFEYEYDSYYGYDEYGYYSGYESDYPSVSETPGWVTFQQDSDYNSSAFPDAQAAWNAAVSTEEAQIQALRDQMEPRPNV